MEFEIGNLRIKIFKSCNIKLFNTVLFIQAKKKALQYKIAIALVIIRNKPAGVSLDEYMGLLRMNFRESFLNNKKQIYLLKSYLLDARKEIFYLKNKEAIELASKNELTIESLLNKPISANQLQKLQNLSEQFESNLEFLTSIVKLKSLDREFSSKLDEINNDTVVECLKSLLNQIGHFVVLSGDKSPALTNKTAHQSNLKFNDVSSHFDSQFTSASYLSGRENLEKQQQKPAESSTLSFPIESILHSAQLFVNVFEIEWFVYSRNALVDHLGKFFDDLITFLLNFEASENVNCFEFSSLNQNQT
jgi:hypothetical protein